jgi:hypothetical protein
MIRFENYIKDKNSVLLENFNDEEVKSYIMSRDERPLNALEIISRLFKLVGSNKINPDQAIRISNQLNLINNNFRRL